MPVTVDKYDTGSDKLYQADARVSASLGQDPKLDGALQHLLVVLTAHSSVGLINTAEEQQVDEVSAILWAEQAAHCRVRGPISLLLEPKLSS